jgi:hypothetical protein
LSREADEELGGEDKTTVISEVQSWDSKSVGSGRTCLYKGKGSIDYVGERKQKDEPAEDTESDAVRFST